MAPRWCPSGTRVSPVYIAVLFRTKSKQVQLPWCLCIAHDRARVATWRTSQLPGNCLRVHHCASRCDSLYADSDSWPTCYDSPSRLGCTADALFVKVTPPSVSRSTYAVESDSELRARVVLLLHFTGAQFSDDACDTHALSMRFMPSCCTVGRHRGGVLLACATIRVCTTAQLTCTSVAPWLCPAVITVRRTHYGALAVVTPAAFRPARPRHRRYDCNRCRCVPPLAVVVVVVVVVLTGW